MEYDSNLSKAEREEVLNKIRNGENPEGITYGYTSECERTLESISDVVDDRLQSIEEWNHLTRNKVFEKETMEITVFVPLAFPLYYKDIYLEDILEDIEDYTEDKREVREFHRGIYLDYIIEYLDDEFREDFTTTEEITDAMWKAEEKLYNALILKDNDDLRYKAEKELYDAIKKDYRVYWCEEIGKIQVKTSDYASDDYKYLIKA